MLGADDPLAYQAWFERRCVALAIMEKAELRPIPGLVPERTKATIETGGAIAKRHRDVVYGGEAAGPSSILLTTMAASSLRR